MKEDVGIEVGILITQKVNIGSKIKQTTSIIVLY